MIELDKTLYKVTNLINTCYEELFPSLPRYPKFSFTRAMITIWKDVVYNKLENTLSNEFISLFKEVRDNKMQKFLNTKIHEGKGVTSKIIEIEKASPKELLVIRYTLQFM